LDTSGTLLAGEHTYQFLSTNSIESRQIVLRQLSQHIRRNALVVVPEHVADASYFLQKAAHLFDTMDRG
jgi:hypothetical protein